MNAYYRIVRRPKATFYHGGVAGLAIGKFILPAALMESANKVPFCSSGYDALDIGWVVPGGRVGAKRCD
jgi:hypothetical protein